MANNYKLSRNLKVIDGGPPLTEQQHIDDICNVHFSPIELTKAQAVEQTGKMLDYVNKTVSCAAALCCDDKATLLKLASNEEFTDMVDIHDALNRGAEAAANIKELLESAAARLMVVLTIIARDHEGGDDDPDGGEAAGGDPAAPTPAKGGTHG